MSTDREDFERGAIAKGWSIAPAQSQLRGIHTPHQYHMPGVEMAWQGFQLARASQRSKLADSGLTHSAQDVAQMREDWHTSSYFCAADNLPGLLMDHDKLRALIAEDAPEPCTSEDAWNCKHCNKTATCKAIKDPRNFAEKPAAAGKVAPLFEGLSPEGVPKPRIVAILEEALKEAKAGNVESLAIAYPRFSGGTTTDWENAQNTLRSIGAVSHLLARMNLDLIQTCIITEVENDD